MRAPIAAAIAVWLAAGYARAAEVPLPGPGTRASPPAAAAAGAKEAKARAYFTDTVLQDQAGKPVRFYSDVLAGNVVCLSFIFTQCTEACPLIMQKLSRVREVLGPRAGEVRFVSLSVDPANDTPAALRAFAARHRTEAPAFTYLTGAKADMQVVLRKLGEWVDDPGDHTTAFVAGNVRTHHWTKIRPDAPPQAVAEILRGLADEGRDGVAPAAAATGPAPAGSAN